jgi:hypothetical protein
VLAASTAAASNVRCRCCLARCAEKGGCGSPLSPAGGRPPCMVHSVQAVPCLNCSHAACCALIRHKPETEQASRQASTCVVCGVVEDDVAVVCEEGREGLSLAPCAPASHVWCVGTVPGSRAKPSGLPGREAPGAQPSWQPRCGPASLVCTSRGITTTTAAGWGYVQTGNNAGAAQPGQGYVAMGLVPQHCSAPHSAAPGGLTAFAGGQVCILGPLPLWLALVRPCVSLHPASHTGRDAVGQLPWQLCRWLHHAARHPGSWMEGRRPGVHIGDQQQDSYWWGLHSLAGASGPPVPAPLSPLIACIGLIQGCEHADVCVYCAWSAPMWLEPAA